MSPLLGCLFFALYLGLVLGSSLEDGIQNNHENETDELQLIFKLDKERHEIYDLINMTCILPTISPVPDYSLFNITLLKNEAVIQTTKTEKIPDENAKKMIINANINATLNYDKDVAICQITTTTGKHHEARLDLEIYVNEVLEMDTIQGPVMEGQQLRINCEVPRTKGNVSENNLKVFIGEIQLNGTSMQENADQTKRLFFHEVLTVKAEYQNANISCLYLSPYGDPQQRSMILIISNSNWNPSMGTIIGVVIGTMALVGLVICCGFKWYRKKKRKKVRRMKNETKLRRFFKFAFSQYDEIDEKKIQHPDNVQPTFVEEEQEAELPTLSEKVPPDYISIRSTSSEESEDNQAEPVQAPPQRTGRDIAIPYMIKVFTEPKYENEGQLAVAAGCSSRQEETGYLKWRQPAQEEPGYLNKDQVAQEGAGYLNEGQLAQDEDVDYDDTVAPGPPQDPKNESETETWLKSNYISKETCDKLYREKIRKVSDFKGMTEQDLIRLDLPVGEAIRLRMALEKLRKETPVSSTTGDNVLKIL